jgi:hypothetical protein
MMGVSPERLSYRQYQALLIEWNDRHRADRDKPAPRSGEELEPLKRFLAAHSVH